MKDNFGVWSGNVTLNLTIKERPRALIQNITPNPAIYGAEVSFYGNGTTKYEIKAYKWRSNIDGDLSGQRNFSNSNLSVGVHTIYFKVQDNQGVWSLEVTRKLTINEREEEPINKRKPTVSFTSLKDGIEIDKTAKTFTIKGKASDDVKITKVQIKIDDGEWKDAKGTTNWSFEWNLTDVKTGKHTISIRAFDGENYSKIEKVEIDVVEKKDIDDNGEESGFNMIYIVPIIGIIAVVCIIGILLYRKRSLPPETLQSSQELQREQNQTQQIPQFQHQESQSVWQPPQQPQPALQERKSEPQILPPTKKRCPNCGKELQDWVKFCIECGARLR